MNQETKIKLTYRVAVVSGIFCGVVALLLLLNFWHMKQHEPLESATIKALVSRLAEEPNNDELKQEIRSFDLLARKAYFTSRWQIKTGTYLLLFGGILLAISLKIYTDLRARIGQPEEITEELLKARANAQYWLLLTGGLVLGLALTAAYLSNDFLKEYQQMAVNEVPAEVSSDVEVIEVFPSEQQASKTDPVQETEPSTPLTTEGQPGTQEAVSIEQSVSESAQPVSESAQPVSASIVYGIEDFKKNHSTFRGYLGQGVSFHKNIPVQWNGTSGENIKWKVAFSRPGYNSPVIWGDKLFISGGDSQARVVACYNRHTGQLLWESEVKDIPGSPASPPRVTDDTGLAAPTMSVDGHRVYAIFATGDIIAFDLEGKKVWGRNLGVPNNHYGHSSSLLVWENRVVVQYDTNTKGRMLALSTVTGETLWDVDRSVHISWASPTLIELDGKMQVVTSSDPYVSGYDLETGAELWKVEAMMGEVAPSIAFDDGVVFATNEYARLIAVKPEPGAGFIWEDDEYLAEVASPVAYKGLLYIATSYGVLVCYDAKTGEKYWEKEFNEGFYSSPMIADGNLYIIDMGGITHILKADKTGTIIGEPELGEGGFALPAFADGVIYLRGTEHLYCIGE
ncbi:MAG: PQQ-binding-like beta-propeller repeat protein [Bacteroidales bacterium]|nr:PQQ-binding-like beta-propeller repeat protein [Bacteroidales bacterium]